MLYLVADDFRGSTIQPKEMDQYPDSLNPGSSVNQSNLELSTKVDEEEDCRSKNGTLVDKVHPTPLRKPLQSRA